MHTRKLEGHYYFVESLTGEKGECRIRGLLTNSALEFHTADVSTLSLFTRPTQSYSMIGGGMSRRSRMR